MHFFAKKKLIGFCLVSAMVAGVVAQEKNNPFSWLNRSEKKLAGNVIVNLVPQPGDGIYQLEFKVNWNDEQGNPIADMSQMPFLCLSKYDLDLDPAQKVICPAFELKKPSPLLFQAGEKLILQMMDRYAGEIKIAVRFQYAMTRALYLSGKSEPIDLMGTNELRMVFQVKSRKPTETEITAEAGKRKREADVASALRKAEDRYQGVKLIVKGFEDRKSIDQVERPNYLQDLEELEQKISHEKAGLSPDSLPADGFQLYWERYNQLKEAVFELRSANLSFQLSRTGVDNGTDVSLNMRKSDSLRNLVRGKYEPLIKGQLDSLAKIAIRQKSIAIEFSSMIPAANGRKTDNKKVDSLSAVHGMVRKSYLDLQLGHQNTWNDYRQDIDSLMPVREIQDLHTAILEGEKDLQSAMDLFDKGVAAILPAPDDTPWYASNRLLWTGLLGLLLLVFASAIWTSARNRKIVREQISSMELAGPAVQNVKPPANGVAGDELTSHYYTASYESSIPESVVGKIHYHTSAIKSVYHLVHGALLEKRGGDFGGYLFGNQYKLPGKGSARSEIFIEKVCDSRYLRSTIPNDTIARADLIDELDKLVRQNKKYRLIGWFTSSSDNSMEIPEGLMKIHRTFFKEKWQIGILLNPGSEVLQGAGFFRRSSGYLDPLPDPAAFLKWDEMYSFALNPASTPENGTDKKDRSKTDYSRVALNNTWGDSIVTAVNFDPPVLGEILSGAANQAIPKDTFQVVGYLYGSAEIQPAADGKGNEFEVFVDRFIELSNELTPRELPGLKLVGWWGQANVDVMHYLPSAISYHEQTFQDAWQISCLVNPTAGDLRIFTRKHSLEMNNNTIETEEYELKSLLSR